MTPSPAFLPAHLCLTLPGPFSWPFQGGGGFPGERQRDGAETPQRSEEAPRPKRVCERKGTATATTQGTKKRAARGASGSVVLDSAGWLYRTSNVMAWATQTGVFLSRFLAGENCILSAVPIAALSIAS